ncbi:MAG: aminoacyl-tRNA hydrolase [Lachnospiraceae bacterium]|nr:aminoacyl-tRNA hydrolase [Lachnospiraceae bacterium]
MYIIAGLGNPTSQYKGTRHNVGFEVIDRIASKYNINVETKKFKGLVGTGMIGHEKVVLLKPQTYMNLSGESVQEAMNFYKPDMDQLIVIYDDVSLPPGQLRVRGKGSAGGHNGMKNIILHCGSQDFPRVRVGIGEKNPHQDLADYVLGHFQGEDKKLMDEAYDEAVEAVKTLVLDGLNEAMNQFNRAKK